MVFKFSPAMFWFHNRPFFPLISPMLYLCWCLFSDISATYISTLVLNVTLKNNTQVEALRCKRWKVWCIRLVLSWADERPKFIDICINFSQPGFSSVFFSFRFLFCCSLFSHFLSFPVKSSNYKMSKTFFIRLMKLLLSLLLPQIQINHSILRYSILKRIVQCNQNSWFTSNFSRNQLAAFD